MLINSWVSDLTFLPCILHGCTVHIVLIPWIFEQGDEQLNSSTRFNLAFRISSVAYPEVSSCDSLKDSMSIFDFTSITEDKF